jgi:SAM-dependent methyltransferase
LESLLVLRQPENGWLWMRAWGGKEEKLAVDVARNTVVDTFLHAHERGRCPEPLEWLLQVDGDAVLHPETLRRLLSWGQPCVGALCVTRYTPPLPVVFGEMTAETSPTTRRYRVMVDQLLDWLLKHPQLATREGPACLEEAPEGSLWQVGFTGAHCFLVHRRVYEALDPPWFGIDPRSAHGTGVDRLFFERVREAGFPVYVDCSVVAGHLGPRCLGMLDWLAWMGRLQVSEPTAGDREALGPEWYDQQAREAVGPLERGPEARMAPLWRAVADRLRRLGARSVVELGCGAGQLAELLQERRQIDGYVGVDFSAVRLAEARTACPDLEFVEAELGAWDGLRVRRYDAVAAVETLEHLEYDLEQVGRIRPGAWLVATVPSFHYPGHVRAFASAGEVKARYGRYLEAATFEVQPLDVRGALYWVMGGRRE